MHIFLAKKWLVGDISSWGNRPSPTKQQDAITGQHKSASFDKNTMDDHDQEDEENLSEHSLGSCSAEIAAINAYEEAKETMKKNEKQAKKKQIKQQQSMDSALMAKKPKVIEPVRPQPFRPQPQFPIAPTFFGGSVLSIKLIIYTYICIRLLAL
jgi:hypothetical protein